MRNFFRPVSLVVVVVLCVLCGLPVVSAVDLDAPLDVAADVVSDLDDFIKSDVSSESVPDVPMESDDSPESVPDVPMESDDSPLPASDASMESDDSPETVPDVPMKSDDYPESASDVLVKPEGDSVLLESAFPSGSDVRVEFQNNSMISVPSAALDGSEESPSRSSDNADENVQSVLSALFGPYTPRMQTVTTYFNGEVVSTEEQVIPGIAGLDFEWLASVGLFSLMLWCLFRLLGGLSKHG